MPSRKKTKTTKKALGRGAGKQLRAKKNLQQKSPPNAKKTSTTSKPPVPEQQSPTISDKHKPQTDFPVVGIGASAGGLDAFEEFFSQMPSDSGIAFVVVSHRSPTGTNLLPGLLQKYTAMPVQEAADNLAAKPNAIYLNLAGKNLALFNGTFHIMDIDVQDRLPLPIDYFFRSLANDQKQRAIGVVLSGTGSDGTLGLKAIKGESGMTIAQKPETAKYDAMPRNAIASGCVDYICPMEEMPRHILDYVRGPYLKLPPSGDPESGGGEILQKIFLLLRERTGNDFSLYKTNTIRRRIERRMNIHQIQTPKQYLHYLQENLHEVDALFQEILIGVTSFFRDPDAWDILAEKCLPFLLDAKPNGETVRAWVPGCGTGEEAYSLGILMQEYMARRNIQFRVQIFGTDIDARAIETARKGFYPAGIANDCSSKRIERFFTKEDHHYRVKKEIRDLVIFAPHNVLFSPPFMKLDLLSCRNLLIYLEPRTQRRLFPLFHYALKTPGVLFLGSSETIGEQEEELFEPLDRKWKVYRRKPGSTDRLPLETFPQGRIKNQQELPTGEEPSSRRRPPSISDLIKKLLLDTYGPACVFVNERGEIVYIHGRTGLYLEPAPGLPNLNVGTMVREELRPHLMSALHQVMFQKKESVCQGIDFQTNGNHMLVDLTVKQLEEPEPLRGLYQIIFESRPVSPVPTMHAKKKRGGKEKKTPSPAVVQELHFTKQRLQRTVEELQTANEELKSTNEELQSTNEELQSTNEELETSKEELQSLNEELVTVNTECEGKIEELSESNDDLRNLLNSTEVATIFLDNNLHIRRFTPEVKKIINLIHTDIGRPLADISSNLRDDRLIDKALKVLQTLVFSEEEVQSTDGKWYCLRIFPYRTIRNTIDGLVLTFLSITSVKEAELASREAQEFAEAIIKTVRQPLLVLDGNLRVVIANQAFYRRFQHVASEVEQRLFYQIGDGDWNIPELRRLLEEVLPKNNAIEDYVVDHEFLRIGQQRLLLSGRRLQQQSGRPERILLVLEEALSAQKAGGHASKEQKDL
jgi:two-component system CheB/CheR fusion protein